MHWYELQDMMFLVKCFKNPMDNLIIHDYVEFVIYQTPTFKPFVVKLLLKL